jgi:hypothetical protein
MIWWYLLLSRRHVPALVLGHFQVQTCESEDIIQCVFLSKGRSLLGQRDLVVLRYSHVCKAVTSAKKNVQQYTISIVVWVQFI